MLEIGIEAFIRVEIRAVAGKVKHFNLCCALGQLGFDWLAVVHSQVVQDQENFLWRIFDQGLQEFDQFVAKEKIS